MPFSTLILIVCILLFGLRGYFKGVFVSLGRVFGVVAGYLALVYGLKPCTALIETHLGLDGFFIYLIAGVLIFGVTSSLVNLIFNGLEKLFRKEDAKLSTASRFGGILVGSCLGAVCGLMIIYCISLLQEVRDFKALQANTQVDQQQQTDSAQDTDEEHSPLERSARKFISGATGQIMKLTSPETASLTAAFVESPTTLVRNLQAVNSNTTFRNLLNDKNFHQLLESGDIDAIQNDQRFKKLAQMSEMRQLLQLAGADKNASERQLATWAANSWKKVEQIRNQEEIQSILRDPSFQKKLESGDNLSLMTDPKTRILLEKFFNTAPSN
jgi:uncharacterized membrane protein required for colicin V production